MAWNHQQAIDWQLVHRLPDHTRFPHDAHVTAGIPPTKNEVIVASSMGPIGPARRDVDAGILPGLLHFAGVHLASAIRQSARSTSRRTFAPLLSCRDRVPEVRSVTHSF